MVDLADSVRLLKKSSDEAEILLEQRRLQEEDFSNICEQHMESWKPTQKTTDPTCEKAWQMNQSSEIKGMSWTKTGHSAELGQRK